jgi:hypothetical protein
MLKRHLMTDHKLTPEQYRQRWELPSSYPLVAPNYAKTRSALAKKFGLGRKGSAAPKNAGAESRSQDGGASVIGYRRQPITFIFSPVDHKPAMPHPSPNLALAGSADRLRPKAVRAIKYLRSEIQQMFSCDTEASAISIESQNYQALR